MKRVSAFQIELEFESVVFFKERGRLEYLAKNLSEQGREPMYNKLNKYIWRRCQDSNPGHIGGRRVLSLLCHPSSPCCHLYEVHSGLSEPIQWYINFTLIVSATDGGYNSSTKSIRSTQKVDSIHPTQRITQVPSSSFQTSTIQQQCFYTSQTL